MFGKKKGKNPESSSIVELLKLRKRAIVQKWIDKVLETYPEDGAIFFRSKPHSFTNPVGHRIFSGIEGLFSELVTEEFSKDAEDFLDQVIRVRAVQDFTPGDALAFGFALKGVIREELAGDLKDNIGLMEELLELESKIDRLALLSFDIYAGCRERLFQLKVEEIKKRPFLQLQGASCPTAAMSLRQIREFRQGLKTDDKVGSCDANARSGEGLGNSHTTE